MAKATRAARLRRDETAGAETVGALVLFGIFVTVIAMLNVTAVPDAGLAAEETHHARVLDVLGSLQADAEGVSIPSAVGADVGRVLPLGPERDPGQDFFSFFMASPAQAAGQLSFTADYGNVTLSHKKNGNPATLYDVGGPLVRFPLGRVLFDPHPIFRQEGVVQLEGGALVTTTPTTETIHFAPPITLSVQGGVTHLAVKVRALNGSAQDLGGTSGVRVGLSTEVATLTSAQAANAEEATLRLETDHGIAWGEWLNATSLDGGLTGAQFTTAVSMGTAPGGLDVVTWTVLGTGSQNDVRLTTGLAVHGVRFG